MGNIMLAISNAKKNGVVKSMNLKKVVYDVIQNHRRKALRKYGQGVRISKDCHLQGNIECGNNITIGVGAYFVSTGATIHIHDHVVFGPNVTIYSGDHPTDVIGKHISEITDDDKKSLEKEYDADVVIESGCWIGTRAIILKGVTIGRGSVIGAGAIVTKDIQPYSIYVGVPSAKCIDRFSDEQIVEHESMLLNRGICVR